MNQKALIFMSIMHKLILYNRRVHYGRQMTSRPALRTLRSSGVGSARLEIFYDNLVTYVQDDGRYTGRLVSQSKRLMWPRSTSRILNIEAWKAIMTILPSILADELFCRDSKDRSNDCIVREHKI